MITLFALTNGKDKRIGFASTPAAAKLVLEEEFETHQWAYVRIVWQGGEQTVRSSDAQDFLDNLEA